MYCHSRPNAAANSRTGRNTVSKRLGLIVCTGEWERQVLNLQASAVLLTSPPHDLKATDAHLPSLSSRTQQVPVDVICFVCNPQYHAPDLQGPHTSGPVHLFTDG